MYDIFKNVLSFVILQESRTLEINNVQDGTWHGPGVGAYNEGSSGILELRAPPVVSIQSSEPL